MDAMLKMVALLKKGPNKNQHSTLFAEMCVSLKKKPC